MNIDARKELLARFIVAIAPALLVDGRTASSIINEAEDLVEQAERVENYWLAAQNPQSWMPVTINRPSGPNDFSQFPAANQEVLGNIQLQKHIQAIKVYREQTHCSLKDAKEYIDFLRGV